MSDFFPQSRWSLIIRNNGSDRQLADAALNSLCSIYWRPVFDFIRQRITTTQDAEDLTQGYFASLLERNYLKQADPSRGKLRAFLVKDIQFYLSTQRRKSHAACRGGGGGILSLDAKNDLGASLPEPMSENSQPDVDFDKQFAAAMMKHALDRLEQESKLGHDVFAEIRQFLFWGDGDDSYSVIAKRLGESEGNIKTMVKRMRSLFSIILREEVSQAVENQADIESELRYLAHLME